MNRTYIDTRIDTKLNFILPQLGILSTILPDIGLCKFIIIRANLKHISSIHFINYSRYASQIKRKCGLFRIHMVQDRRTASILLRCIHKPRGQLRGKE